MNKRPWYKYLKDCIIYAVILFALVFVGITYFENATKADLLDLITQYVGFVATILLGFIGIIEFAYDNGLDFLVPTKFEEYKEEKLREQTKEYLKEYEASFGAMTQTETENGRYSWICCPWPWQI